MSADGARLGAALDIESAPSADLVQMAGAGSRRGFERPALHKIVCGSILTYRQCLATGAFSSVRMHTFTSEVRPEASIIVGLDLLLPSAAEEETRLLTWNGHHDLRMLQSRAVALWMTELKALPGWVGAQWSDRHLDLMREGGGGPRGWARLRDVCAGLGFSLHSGDDTMTTALARGEWHRVESHNRMDVFGTFLVHAAREAFRRGCPLPASTAWAEVARICREAPKACVHEAALATHFLVGVAARQLAGHDRRRCGCAPVRRAA